MPLLNRRPDIVVFDSAAPDDQVLRPEDCRLVVEVMSASSVTADQLDKPAEYSAAGIEHYWRVEGHTERGRLRLLRHQLNRTRSTYDLVSVDNALVTVGSPIAAEFDLRELL